LARRSISVSVRSSPGLFPGLLVGVFFELVAGPAAAHTQAGSLGSGAAATDVYQVICSDDGAGPPASLSIQVLDGSPAAAPLVSVQVRNSLELANSTDPTDGDTTASPLVHVNAGSGTVFDVLVDKSGAGAENYVLTFHCVTGPDGTGLHTGTDVIARQNQ
jgi:hypothetical protein